MSELTVSPPYSSSVNDRQRCSLGFSDIRILALSALGGALEFYDFVIFVFFAAVMGALFFPAEVPEWMRLVQTFGIFAAGYLARPLGGIVMAHFGDLLGRKRMFMFSILLMALPTLVIGLLPTYATIGVAAPLLLLLMRLCQGAAIGGEAPGAWVFVTEHVPSRHTGIACASLTMGLIVGILLGSLVASALTHAYSDEQLMAWAWRIPFLLGGVLGLVTLYLRRYLHETPVFAEMKQQQSASAAQEMPVKQVFRQHRGSVVLSMLVTWILTGAVVVGLLMMPTLLQMSFGIARSTSLAANSIAIGLSALGCMLSGWLADRIGFGRALLLCGLGFIAGFGAMGIALHLDTGWLYPSYAVAGFFGGIVGIVPGVMVRAFPPQVRFSGVSFSYNLAYAVFGGLTPLIISLLAARWDYMPTVYLILLGLMACAIGGWLLVRESPPAR
ncbi:Proline/betaine transporter [Carnimonas sp. R-84981]|uniref:MFS transporter n=1 Tax=Carnimonas bestiolae TaxID=3402172 RepID=UPI003EDC8CDB